MSLPDDQVQELKALCPGVAQAEEGGKTYFLLPKLKFTSGATTVELDALLCASPRDGYESRLFLAQKVDSPKPLNWNASGVPILGKAWWAHSWKTRSGLRLAQMVAEHLAAFQR